ncbi:MAG: aldose 1-epimerase [Chloroflexi bacterium]|nr:aldose 1-epimerase [Chloroflexota bacterium]
MAAPRFTITKIANLALAQAGYCLRDERTGAEARVLPSLGANVTGLRLAVRGQTHEVLVPEPAAGAPARGVGAPVLFPYPNRVRAGRYTWQGTSRQLPTHGGAHAVHGLVLDQPFAVTDTHAGEQSASLACAISAAAVPELADAWPFAFRLEITYTLLPGGLRTQATVVNEGSEPMPFGLGFHPYFRVPLVPDGRREDCRVQMWAPLVWEVDADQVPTGRQAPAPNTHDPRGYPALATTAYDTFYTRLALDDPGAGTWSSRLLDPAADLEVIVVADAAFREAVLFAPLNRPVVSIEPYTCVADALNLAARGIDAGLLVLPPGERWSAGYTITARGVAMADGVVAMS